jgi:microcystin-dependent protein
MDPFIGQIMLWPVPWVPEGWQLCDGSLLPIQQYEALYSLLGTRYGGNGTTTFGVPDLRNRVPTGTTSASAPLQQGGSPTTQISTIASGAVTLNVNNLPSHTHTATFSASGGSANVSIAIPAVANPVNQTDAPGPTVSLATSVPQGPDLTTIYSSDTPTNTTLRPFTVSVPAGGGSVTNANTGGGQPVAITAQVNAVVNNMQPYIAMNYIIALNGLYPPRP